MIALLSDIHGNLEALEAVLADARNRGVASYYCLGDSVGFGPNPRQCVELVQEFELSLSGNWDYFITDRGLSDSRRSNDELKFWYDWVRSEITTEQIEFLGSRPSVHRIGNKTYAHGDPIDTVNGYLFPETIYQAEKMHQYFAAFDGIFHCGHTHIGGVFSETKFEEANTFDKKFSLGVSNAIINVGSVGMPRDGDRRACYVIDHGEEYEFIRVPYDIETTKRKIRDLGPPGS